MGDVVKGPWKAPENFVDPSRVRWRKGRPIEPTKEKCVDCDRPFHPKAWIPVDRVCADCRDARQAALDELAVPTLFDPEDTN